RKVVRYRPRRRRLFLRLLHGNEEHRDRAGQSRDTEDRDVRFGRAASSVTLSLEGEGCAAIRERRNHMPLRDPVFNPPFNIVRASHVELGVSDLAASRAFYVDCLGYNVSGEDADALYLRAVEERNHHSIVLRKSREIVALALGYKVGSEEDLDKAAAWLQCRNLPVEWPEHPHQGRTLRTHDPVGMPIDLYFKMDRVKPALQQYTLHLGARIQRLDHINCFTPD